MKYFQAFPEEVRDSIRLEAFIEEGRWHLVGFLFQKYEGKLMDIVFNEERATGLYITLRSMNKPALAIRFLKELGMKGNDVDAFEREYRTKEATYSEKPIPSVRTLREILVEPL